MRPDPDTCPECGLSYDNFRTGETFASVKESMFVASDDPTHWRYRTRAMVLGVWHATKRVLFASHIAECEHYARSIDDNATVDCLTGRRLDRGCRGWVSRNGVCFNVDGDAVAGGFVT